MRVVSRVSGAEVHPIMLCSLFQYVRISICISLYLIHMYLRVIREPLLIPSARDLSAKVR